MTKWQSLSLKRNESSKCQCFDCLRAQGITSLHPDCLGHIRDRRDGRFTANIKEVKDTQGNVIIKSQKLMYVGS